MPLDSLLFLILRSSYGGFSVEKHQTITDNTHYSLSTLSEDMLKSQPTRETSIEAGTFFKLRTTSNAFMLQSIHKRWADTINHLLRPVPLREGVGGNSSLAAKIFLTFFLCRTKLARHLFPEVLFT